MNDEEVVLTEVEVSDALNREDELGKLVLSAFSFKIPPIDSTFFINATDDKEDA